MKTIGVGGLVTYTFTDVTGQKLLERRMNGDTALDTYYVYDMAGNLRFVLQPMYQEEQSLEKYAFQYRYDDRRNVVEKQLPGAEPIRYSYDRANRVAFLQDGRQRSLGAMTFMLYDGHGRKVLKGTCSGSNLPSVRTAFAEAQFDASQDGISMSGYITSSVALENPRAEAAWYYDTYDCLASSIFDGLDFPADTACAKGLLTGEVSCFPDEEEENPAICSIYHYDAKGRMVKTYKTNIIRGTEETTISHSMTDKPLEVRHEVRYHNPDTDETDTMVEKTTYSYDHGDRLVKTTHQLNDQTPMTVAENSYDGLCRMAQKTVMGEQVAYQHNLQDWVTSISSPHFTQQQEYALDGNVLTQRWRHGGGTTPWQQYCFSYDGLSRLTAAAYSSGQQQETYSAAYSYDRNGNIMQLQRNALNVDGETAVMDDLTMTYDGNRLIQVDNNSDALDFANGCRYDGGNELEYDENGCLTKDKDKSISQIQYNSLNLPTYIHHGMMGSVSYIYDAAGQKLQQQHMIGRRYVMSPSYSMAANRPIHKPVYHTVSYCGNFIFENFRLKRILIDGGFIYFTDSTATYHYYLTDNLGSNREVVNVADGQVAERYDYYPFGKQTGEYHTGYIHPYRYNGKELDEVSGLNWLYYGARMMEPEWGRFTTPDPLAEEYYGTSPYTYCLNNPVRLLDSNGEEPTTYEAALMAKQVYGDNVKLAGGWHLYKEQRESFIDTKIGFRSALYERTLNGETEYAYVTAGTNDPEDIKEDFLQLRGSSNQYLLSVQNAAILNTDFSNKKLTFVGHSLGGGLAAANALMTDRNAITFNPAAITKTTKHRLGLPATTTKGLIFNIVVKGEIVNHLQSKFGLKLEGSTYYLKALYAPWTNTTNTLLRIYNHQIGTIISKLKEEQGK